MRRLGALAVPAVEPDRTVHQRMHNARPRNRAQAWHRLLGTARTEVARRGARHRLRQLAHRATRASRWQADVLHEGARRARPAAVAVAVATLT